MPDLGDVLQVVRLDNDTASLTLETEERFGSSIEYMGDIRGDGTTAIAVGSLWKKSGYGDVQTGTVRIVFLNQDGTLNSVKEITDDISGLNLQQYERFGVDTAYMGQHFADDKHALMIGSDGYDHPTANSAGTWRICTVNKDGEGVIANEDVEETGEDLQAPDQWGSAVCSMGTVRLDQDEDDARILMAVGGRRATSGRGGVKLIYLPKAEEQHSGFSGTGYNIYEIDDTTTNVPTMDDYDEFGFSIANLGDLKGDGTQAMAVGAPGTDSDAGAIHILFLDAAHDGTIDSSITIDKNTSGMPTITDGDWFGASIANLGDIRQDGTLAVAVGSWQWTDPSTDDITGRVYILYLDNTGAITDYDTIDNTSHPELGLGDYDLFGWSVAAVPNLGRDGRTWLAVGTYGWDSLNGIWNTGAVHLLELHSKPVPITVEIPIVADGDDFYEDHVPTEIDTDDLIVGDVSGNKREPHFEFKMSMIPPQATIDEASLRLHPNAVTASTKFRRTGEYPIDTEVDVGTDATVSYTVDKFQLDTGWEDAVQAIVDEGAYDTGDSFALVMKIASSPGGVTSTFDSRNPTDNYIDNYYSPRLYVTYTPRETHFLLDINSAESASQTPPEVEMSIGRLLSPADVEAQAEAEPVTPPDNRIFPADLHSVSMIGGNVDSPVIELSVSFSTVLADLESASEGQTFFVGLPLDNGQAQSEAEAIPVLTGSFLLVMTPPANGAQSAAENDEPDLVHVKGLQVNSAESQSEALRFNTSMNVRAQAEVESFELTVKGPCVKLCTPDGRNERTVTEEAGEQIIAGQVIRVSNNKVWLATNETYEKSQWTGIAITNADVGDYVTYVEEGDIVIPGLGFEVNVVYCVSATGRYLRLQDVSAGEYISIVGIALDAVTLRMGSHFEKLKLTTASTNAPLGTLVTVDQNEVKLGPATTEQPFVLNGPSLATMNAGDAACSARGGYDLADADSIETSEYGGMVISCTTAGCNVAVLVSGDLVVGRAGDSTIVPNMLYVYSNTAGKLMPVTEAKLDDWITFVGIAVSDNTLRVGQVQKGLLAV